MELDPDELLVEQIYDSTDNDSALDGVMADLRRRLKAHCGLMFVNGDDSGRVWNMQNINPAAFVQYPEYYFQFEVLGDAVRAAGLHRSGTIATPEMLVPPETMRRSPLIQELYLPNDMGPFIGTSVHVPGEGPYVQLTFWRTVGADPFAEPEIATLRRFSSHLERMSRVRFRLEREAPRNHWSLEVIEALPWGVLVLDRRGRCIFLNAAAKHILALNDGLSLHTLGLRGRGDAGVRLEHTIAVATGLSRKPRIGSDLAIPRPSLRRPWLLSVLPVGFEHASNFDQRDAAAVVHVMPPSVDLELACEHLKIAFNLTTAEQKLTVDLILGLSVAGSALKSGIKVSTARTHLLRAMAKTATARQAELVAVCIPYVISATRI